MTHKYELMVILSPEIDERQVPANLERFLKVITNDGGTVDSVEIWGKRRLAYEIEKKTEGIYAVVNFTASSAATQELDRQLGLAEQIMRTKVLRAEDAIAMIASEAKRSEEKAARRAANPKAATAPAAKVASAPAKTSAPRAPRRTETAEAKA